LLQGLIIQTRCKERGNMLNILVALLPHKYKAMINVAEKILQNIDTEEERKQIINHINNMFDKTGKGGSRVTVGEWAKLGGLLGILKSK
jgi:fibrillarin-like rRNA methylase